MGVDHNLLTQGIRPLQVESPVNALAQVMQLKDAQQRGALNALQLQGAQDERANALALNDAYKNAYGPDGKLNQNALFGDLAKRGLGSHIPKAQASLTAAEKAQVELAGAKQTNEAGAFKLAQDKLNQHRQSLAAVNDYAAAQRWVTDGLKAGLFNMAKASEGLAAIPQDPAGFAKWKANQQAVGLTVAQQMEQEWKARGFQLETDKFGEAKRHNRSTEGIAGGNLAVARDRLAMERDQPKGVYDPARGVVVDPRTATGKPVTVGGQPLPAAKPVNMSPTMQKEVFEADDTVQSGKAVINILNQAKKINEKAYSGYGAKTRAVVRSNLPGESEAADATINLDNMMTGQALESLKLVFGGMPTEGERKILLEMQASADKTPGQRKDIIDRAIRAAETRVAFNEKKAKALRDGTYMTQGVKNDPVQPGAAPVAPATGAKFLGFEN
jgi:hypothetical protein